MSCITTEEGGHSVPATLPGFRFCPSDKDLVDYYLKMKIEGNDSNFRHIIPVIDLCKFEPADLPAFFIEPDSPHHDREWIFFTRLDRKYTNSNRCNRTTEKGFYKITGKERDIQARQSKAVIGKKRTLTFYQGRTPKAKRTDWGLHELFLCKTETGMGPNPHQQRDFVVCRLRDKSANCKSGNKKLKDDLICDGIADSGNGSYIALNPTDDQAAANDMISDPVEHLPYEEPGEYNDSPNEPGEYNDSPNGSSLMDNVNDISTCDDDEIFSNFDGQAANELLQELWAVLGENLDSPFPPPQPTHQPPLHQPSQQHQPPLSYQPSQPHQLPQSPQSQGYCFSTLQSLLCTEQGIVPYVFGGDCSKQQYPIGDNNSYPAHKNQISTNDHNEPVSNIVDGDRAADERISEAYFQPEDNLGSLFHPLDLQDYTLMSPMTGELGDVVHRQ